MDQTYSHVLKLPIYRSESSPYLLVRFQVRWEHPVLIANA